MKDRDFLVWLHNRLRFEHDEHPGRDYMGKLRSMIMAIPPEQETPNSMPAAEGLTWQTHIPTPRRS